MTAYRERPPGALDLAPPAPDAPWYEQLAHQLVLAHQPVARPRGPTPAQMLGVAMKYYKPQCARCGHEVGQLVLIQSAIDRTIIVHAFCHGETEPFEVDERAIMVRAGDKHALAYYLEDQLRRKVFAL